MGICRWTRLLAIATLILMFHVGSVFGAPARSWKIVTIENQEIEFFKVNDRPTVKGWLNGTALEIPATAVSQIVFFDTPNASYSIYGTKVSSGEVEITRKTDGRKFILQDAFLPYDCDCTHLTYTYRNPFTDEFIKGSLDLSGIKKIIYYNE